jgi:hypothetical protein
MGLQARASVQQGQACSDAMTAKNMHARMPLPSDHDAEY